MSRFSRRSLLAATGAAVFAGRISAPAFAAAAFEQRFGRMSDRQGWGAHWFSPHYTLRFDVDHGRARLHLREGLSSTAPSQPVPVFLLDHECTDGSHEMRFRVTSTSLRPGLLFRRRKNARFLAVTVEEQELVLASYRRSNRRVLARARLARALGLADHVLRVVVSGQRLAAGIWLAGDPPKMQLHAALPGVTAGTPGVLLVAPTNLQEAALLVGHYRLTTPVRFRPTEPEAAFLITGTPQRAGSSDTVALRAASDIPATIQFEWSQDRTFATGVERSSVFSPSPPFTARTDVAVVESQPTFWRARFTSKGGVRSHSPTHRYTRHRDGDRLVMGAASCAHLWNEPAYDGLRRFREAAPEPPAMLVFQGDLGYAGNGRFSCYLESRDFYAERFTRTLDDPHFRSLREAVPVGFTIDDHDYSQTNNAAPAQMPSWAVPLWNDFHADPSSLGYFDFRFGDVHCVTLDGRRYADPVTDPNTPQKTKLGQTQRDWLEALLAATDASLIVVFSADIFASRSGTLDCFLFGWPDEYRRLMADFMDVQLRGVRVVILSGDAHGLRIHHHPDPSRRTAAAGRSVVEFICSGLAPRSWSGPVTDDPTLDQSRFVLNHRGLGMIDIDPPSATDRRVRLRAISGEVAGPIDLFPPLDLTFAPRRDVSSSPLQPPVPSFDLGTHPVE